MTDKTSKKPSQKSAVAIKYDQSSQDAGINDGESSAGAPTIIAKGFGDLAQEIITLARQNGVLVHEDPYLSDFLATLDLGQEIPDQLYHVIAELISFSYVLQGKFPDSWAKMHNKVSKKV
ncbi:EscU/YscU/HrcU family type III secretion system export apparatus switch protein [Paraglaciecola sp. MB-3u-78]|jgi:flagellar biosynthesis protein|uniref:EscU/YscU/HrcU family type III secretion system export apparatus switch protein n=1 Tax=Paraglaciecola sp. MB-3u-78 TaxID=2058332 RepID=UPI000C32C93E|nr:EscU/YscU/HrcU family type III secretion system export apparatus switch protein [Paraglaciecola sp. MB-3u-78]PKG98886.1 flagellar biosynthesis protein FlhB [Paraglaciecola sp. MB-3u-78]